MKFHLIVVLALALASPVTAQNEAAPDSTVTERSRARRIVEGAVAGGFLGFVGGLHYCGGDSFAANAMRTVETPCDSRTRLSAGRIALMGAAAGALLGVVLTEPSEEVAKLRIGLARRQPGRLEVGIELRAWREWPTRLRQRSLPGTMFSAPSRRRSSRPPTSGSSTDPPPSRSTPSWPGGSFPAPRFRVCPLVRANVLR